MIVVGGMLLRCLLLLTTVDGLRPPHITRRSAIGGLLSGSSLSLSAPPALGASVPQGPLCSPDVAVLQTAGAKQIIVIGTAHVSDESVALVQQVIREVQPETVMVELDKPRAVTLLRKERARRKGGGGEAAGVIPSGASDAGIASFYQSLEEMGLQNGGEFVAAIEEASRLNATVVLGDQDIQVTMARLQEANEEVRRLRRQGALARDGDPAAAAARPLLDLRVDGASTRAQVQQMTADLLQPSNVRAVREYMRAQAPPVYEALIAERDRYMAHALRDCEGSSVVGVVGLAHLDGIVQTLMREEGARARGCALPVVKSNRGQAGGCDRESPPDRCVVAAKRLRYIQGL